MSLQTIFELIRVCYIPQCTAGSAFHSRGAAAEKALSPKALVLVRGCMNVICREERSALYITLLQ